MQGRNTRSRAARNEQHTESAVVHSQKEVVFIRHGHSLGQAAHRDQRKKDERLRDADLSPKGLSQVHGLGQMIRAAKERNTVNHELVLSSPLTRALKTALVAVQDEKVIAHPGFAELNDRRPIPENRGRTLEELVCDEDMLDLGLTDRVDLSHAEALSWPKGSPVDGMAFLKGRPESRVVIFSHHNYIMRQLSPGTVHYVDNCDPLHAIVEYFDSSHRVTLVPGEHSWWNLKRTRSFAGDD